MRRIWHLFAGIFYHWVTLRGYCILFFINLVDMIMVRYIRREKNAPNTELIGILYPVRCKLLTFQIVMHIGIIISMPGD